MGIRDFVQGDYLSGTIRMIDALLVAACIAIGTGFVLWCYSLLTGVNSMSLLTNAVLGTLVAQFFLAAAGTLSFAILFACPRRLLPYCALVGGVGWLVYELAVLLGANSTTASLLAVIPLTLLTRVLAILLKAPVTVFLLTGIFRWCREPVSTTRPIILSRATTRWPFPMVFPLLKSPSCWPLASRWCWASPCLPQALSACFLIYPHIYIHFPPFSA